MYVISVGAQNRKKCFSRLCLINRKSESQIKQTSNLVVCFKEVIVKEEEPDTIEDIDCRKHHRSLNYEDNLHAVVSEQRRSSQVHVIELFVNLF